MSETTNVRGVEFKACACGCDQPVAKRATYRPGHDARHAGQVGRDVAERLAAQPEGGDLNDPENYDDLPTPALQTKAQRVAEKHYARITKRSEVEPDRGSDGHGEIQARLEATEAQVTGTFKIGRWDYPARMTSAGKVQYNSKRDGSGVWETLGPGNAQAVKWND